MLSNGAKISVHVAKLLYFEVFEIRVWCMVLPCPWEGASKQGWGLGRHQSCHQFFYGKKGIPVYEALAITGSGNGQMYATLP